MVHQIDHPEQENRTLPVEVVDEAEHRGVEMVQVEAVGSVTLQDQSGNSPWVFADDLSDLGNRGSQSTQGVDEDVEEIGS